MIQGLHQRIIEGVKQGGRAGKKRENSPEMLQELIVRLLKIIF